MSENQSVGYIGLGNIGKPCARRLIGESFNTHVFDVFEPAVAELAELGAIACSSVPDLASRCSHIGICVRDEPQVEALLFGEAGIFKHADKGTLIAIHSTVSQDSLLNWAAQATAIGLHLIDAPITGGAHGAEAGTLCYMVGGSPEQLAMASPVFETSAGKIVHAGDIGAGIALKLCNNFIQYTEFVAMAEATRLAESCGLSVDVLREVGLSNGVVNKQMHMFVSGRNAMARSSSEEEMAQFFGVMGQLGRKDLDCALSTAQAHGVDMPTATFIRDRIENVFVARDESRPPAKGEPSV